MCFPMTSGICAEQLIFKGKLFTNTSLQNLKSQNVLKIFTCVTGGGSDENRTGILQLWFEIFSIKKMLRNN